MQNLNSDQSPASAGEQENCALSSGESNAQSDDAMMNDAYLYGENHPEMQELLQRPFVAMTGDLYGARDRRNTLDGDWKRVELPLLGWMVGKDAGNKTWGLTRHPVASRKEGAAIVFADALDGARTEGAIHTVYALTLDFDGTASLDDVIDKLEAAKVFAIVYTSYRHMITKLEIKHDEIMKKQGLSGSPTLDDVKAYLRENHKDRYADSIIDGVEIVDVRRHTKSGQMTVLRTPPIEKFRVVFPLWEPVNLTDLGGTMQEYKDAYADAATGLALNLLGADFDTSSCNINQVYFTPRHPKDAPDYHIAVMQGRPLRFDEIEVADAKAYKKSRGKGDPFAAGADGADGSGDREQFVTEDGLNLNRWHRTHKDRFLMADVIESFVPDKVRVAGGEKVGTVHLECPFEHEHSTEGGTATMAMNPEASSEGYWTVFCRHDACQGRDKLEFVKQMLEDDWFPEDVLVDEEWLIPLPDEDLPPIVSDADPIPLSAPLWEDGLVTDGFCKAKKVREIRDQIRRNLRGRVSHVIVDGGKGKLFLHPKRGRLPEIWDDNALDKFYRNSRVQYDRKGNKKPGLINPAKEFFEDEQRVTYAGTQFEPDPAKADPHKFNLFNGFPVEPASGDWSLLRNHIRDNLVAGNGSTPEDDEHLFNTS